MRTLFLMLFGFGCSDDKSDVDVDWSRGGGGQSTEDSGAPITAETDGGSQ